MTEDTVGSKTKLPSDDTVVESEDGPSVAPSPTSAQARPVISERRRLGTLRFDCQGDQLLCL